MYAPADILGLLETILGVFLSDIKHRERATFILCDNLIELCCVTRIKERNPNDNSNRNFKKNLEDAKVSRTLRTKILNRHRLRNSMQHHFSLSGIDYHNCADAIIDTTKVIKKLWGKYAFTKAEEWIICALKVVALYSSEGKATDRNKFEQFLFNQIDWRDFDFDNSEIEHQIISKKPRKRLPDKHELIIPINSKEKYNVIIQEFTLEIKSILEEMSIDF